MQDPRRWIVIRKSEVEAAQARLEEECKKVYPVGKLVQYAATHRQIPGGGIKSFWGEYIVLRHLYHNRIEIGNCVTMKKRIVPASSPDLKPLI